jgi:amino acid transporter
VGALVSAVPSLQRHTLLICLGILVVLTLINLRGARETGGIFLIPTYLFIVCMLGMIAVGVIKAIASNGHPVPVVASPKLMQATAGVGIWLLLRAFASGCTAMTGVEAVSNGVMAFKEPTYKYARLTLTIIIAVLMAMLLGIAFLVRTYNIAATVPGAAGYQSVLSQLLAAVSGKGAFYWTSIISILVVLSLSANTAFADFPRLSRAIALNGFLPHALTLRGRRLVFAEGVYALAILTALLLIIFGGVTDRLIPLYAVGAFMAFTLSQAGMVAHWKRVGGAGAHRNMLLNGLGAVATAITLSVVLIAKFTEGAWITVVLIPAMILTMTAVKRHYRAVEKQTWTDTPVNTQDLRAPIVLIPMDRWSVVSEKALRFAWGLSTQIQILHVECGEETESLCRNWARLVEAPAKDANLPIPELVLLKSPFRFVVKPLVAYALKMENENLDTHVAVVLPELMERRWYHLLLHNQRSSALKALLYFQGSQRITVINVPWYLS